ncbi:MAG: hypothetical protein C0404_02795 [Verrucomicrobia bacterium]|nr:hypothetical protein [Verrucomicrobiota bacterium]
MPVVAAGMAYYVGVHVLRRTPITTDEQSYVFQAWTFIEGELVKPYPPFPEVFEHVMIILDPKVGWLSRYPPGHVLWLAIGILLGDPWLVVAIGAGLSLLTLGLAVRRLGADPHVGMWLALCSPFFIFTHGTLLSHTSGFLATSLLLFGYVSWVTTRSTRWAVLAGAAWAWLFLGRTYTGFLLAMPFGIHALVDLYLNRRDRRVWSGVVSFALVAACGVALQLAYNWATLGDPLKMTYLHYDSHEKLGFGSEHYGHTWGNAWNNFSKNGLLLDRWLWGFPTGLLAWTLLAVLGWRRQWSPLFAGAIVLPWIGYLFFYYPGPHEIGPGYYFETLPFMIVAAALGLCRLLNYFRQWRIRWRLVAGGIAVLLLALDFLFAMNATKELRRVFGERSDLLAFLAKAPPRSLIFVEELHVDRSAFDHEDYAMFNPHGLGSDPLVVKSLGGADKAVMRYFHDRAPYDLESRAGLKLVRKDSLRPGKVGIQGENTHKETGANEKNDSSGPGIVRVARAGIHGPGALGYGREFSLFPGHFQAVFDVRVSGAGTNQVVATVDVVRDGGLVELGGSVIRGGTEGSTVFDFDCPGYCLVEPRIFYTGTGTVVFARVVIKELISTKRAKE